MWKPVGVEESPLPALTVAVSVSSRVPPQSAAEYSLNVIVPVGAAPPDRCAVSLYRSPIAPEAGFCVVDNPGEFFATVTGSSLQPVGPAGLLSGSPPYEATQ